MSLTKRFPARFLTVSGIMLGYFSVSAQKDSTSHSPFQFSGYAEIFYAYSFNKPAETRFPPVYYNYARQNEVNLNLAFAKAAWQTDRVRANLAVGIGTYMNANYAAEPGTLKNIYEANAGVKLSRGHHLWLDAGILPSHLGFESATGKDNWTLTRSLAAEQSPYFESGARLSYSDQAGKWYLAALLLNGWQRISRQPGNSLLSWGTQITWKPSAQVSLNYGTFVGTDSPDSLRRWRYFQNFYGIFQFSERVGLTAGFDYGMQQRSRHSRSLQNWYTPVAILRFTPAAQWAVAARAEYYSDRHNLIVSQGSPDGFRSYGYSLNVDYKPVDNLLVRIEGKQLSSPDAVFAKEDLLTSRQFRVITAAIAIAF